MANIIVETDGIYIEMIDDNSMVRLRSISHDPSYKTWDEYEFELDQVPLILDCITELMKLEGIEVPESWLERSVDNSEMAKSIVGQLDVRMTEEINHLKDENGGLRQANAVLKSKLNDYMDSIRGYQATQSEVIKAMFSTDKPTITELMDTCSEQLFDKLNNLRHELWGTQARNIIRDYLMDEYGKTVGYHEVCMEEKDKHVNELKEELANRNIEHSAAIKKMEEDYDALICDFNDESSNSHEVITKLKEEVDSLENDVASLERGLLVKNPVPANKAEVYHGWLTKILEVLNHDELIIMVDTQLESETIDIIDDIEEMFKKEKHC